MGPVRESIGTQDNDESSPSRPPGLSCLSSSKKKKGLLRLSTMTRVWRPARRACWFGGGHRLRLNVRSNVYTKCTLSLCAFSDKPTSVLVHVMHERNGGWMTVKASALLTGASKLRPS
jgi:hypothetical protein